MAVSMCKGLKVIQDDDLPPEKSSQGLTQMDLKAVTPKFDANPLAIPIQPKGIKVPGLG